MARSFLALGLDGVWPALDLARLLHLLVRAYRFEALLALAERERPELLARPFDAVTLKYLAAFDWIAAPLMSRAWNESFLRSEEFVAGLGFDDPVLVRATLAPAGELALAGEEVPLAAVAALLAPFLSFDADWVARPGGGGQGRIGAVEALYDERLRALRPRLAGTGHDEGALHAIVAPALEDLQFVSNAVAQGRITRVEMAGEAG